MGNFRGRMLISPVSAPAFELEADWIYNKRYDCWYGNGESFPAEICTMIREEETP